MSASGSFEMSGACPDQADAVTSNPSGRREGGLVSHQTPSRPTPSRLRNGLDETTRQPSSASRRRSVGVREDHAIAHRLRAAAAPTQLSRKSQVSKRNINIF